jgi:pantoate--beta-alanine ligase
MLLATNHKQILQYVQGWKAKGESVGFVPTMGFLHQGHLSLIEMAKKEHSKTVVSIFINPTQFNDPADYKKYPVDLDKDKKLLQEQGVDCLYLPVPKEIYPEGPEKNKIWVVPEVLDQYLCGATRPGHFKGVLTVVLKLFNQVRADSAYFGKKDWQQARLIQEMVQNLFIPVRIQLGETVREKDGLAMSSRNARLSGAQRKEAVIIYQSMQETRDLFIQGERSRDKLESFLRENLLGAKSGSVDYVQIVDRKNLAPYKGKIKSGQALMAVAMFFGQVRLIDNMEL